MAKLKAEDHMLKMLASREPYDAGAFKGVYYNYRNLRWVGDEKARA
jgi:hypothetical protein